MITLISVYLSIWIGFYVIWGVFEAVCTLIERRKNSEKE